MSGKKIKVGDYVEIVDGVHDSEMPSGQRDGFIKEAIAQEKHRGNPDQFLVVFSNKAVLKFHKSQIRVINQEGEDE
tara:strand:+ start:257 stop:484 length:228 start_codon:yes stop_codon:yes gene_type:complete